MLNNESPARAAADSITKADGMHINQHRSMPTIESSAFCGPALLHWRT